MGTDDDRRLDDELRRRARNTSERHSASVVPADIDQALAAVRTGRGGEPSRSVGGPKRTGWLLVATAASVVVLVAGVAFWPSGESDDRLTSVSVSASVGDGDAGAATERADQSQPPTTAVPVTAPALTSTTTTVVDLPSVALDTEGNEIAAFRLVNGRPTVEPESTAFVETLLDYLLNRSTILGDTISEREDAVFRRGLRISTTFEPELQRAAEQARKELPENAAGIDAAIVSIETSTGAIRTIASGGAPVSGENWINTAIAPRPTGSAVETFILAAALQAGAQPDDIIDGRRGCALPGPWIDPFFPAGEEPYFQINGGVAGYIGPLREMVARSIPCASARLSHIVGLDRVVDTTYGMAESPYLFGGQSESLREPIEPVTDLGVGVNPMSPLDMASGMQTIANAGVHHQPYFVEFVEDAEGDRRYTHEPAPTTVLDPDVALDAVDVLKGTITSGTGQRHPLANGRPAIGKTGTIQNNTDAWFIGATPQLTTAVWVGDPAGSTPMVNLPEFAAVDVNKVQGGMFPAQIWKAFTDAALADRPIEDWESVAPPARPNARLVLPGFECVKFDGGELVWPESDQIGTNVPAGVTDPNFPIPSVVPGSLAEGCN